MNKKGSLFAIFYILFLDNFGFAVIFPLFPSLFLRAQSGFLFHGESEAWRNFILGVILAAFPLGQFFGAPIFGDLADRFGRKKIFYCTILGTTLGYLLTALEVHHRHISAIFISRLITGFFAGNLALCMAAVADLNSEEKQRGRHMGYIATFLGLSWILAIIVGANFADPKHLDRFNPALPFLIIGSLSLTSVFVLAKFFQETHYTKREIPIDPFKGIRNIARILESKMLLIIYLFIFFWLLGFFLTMQWAAPVAIERYKATQSTIMWILALQGILWAIASSWINSYLIHHFSIWSITLWVLVGVFVFFLGAAIAPHLLLFSATFILSGGFSAIGWSNNMNLISTHGLQKDQGKVMGIGQSVTALIQILAPLIGAALAVYSSLLIFYTAAFCVLIGFVIFYGIYIKQKRSL